VRSFFKPTLSQALAQRLQKEGPICQDLAKTLAQRIGVPNHEDRLSERLIGYRWRTDPKLPLTEKHVYGYEDVMYEDVWPMDPETGKPAEMHRVAWLTEEVWSRDHWPHTADEPAVAIDRLPDGQVMGLYYHGPSMCLVLLRPDGMRVGIRATTVIHPKLGIDKPTIAAFDKLKKWEEHP
jgi:hypothetical protein